MRKIIATFFSYGSKQQFSELEVLKVFVDRVKFLEPNMRVIVTTDPMSAVHLASLGVELNVIRVDTEKLLFERCRANLQIIRENRHVDQVIFSDYDIIFNRLPDVGDVEELMLTVRSAKKYPINGGLLVFSRPGVLSEQLYSEVLERYKKCREEDLRWWGDQISLYEALISNRESLLSLHPFNLGGLKVRPASAEHYNWTPFDMDVTPKTLWEHFFLTADMVRDYNGHQVVHFKGPRKHLMMQYARTGFGAGLTRLPVWATESTLQNLTLFTKSIEADLKAGAPSKRSLWEISDDLFSLLALLRLDSAKALELDSVVTSMLRALSEKHQDFRFNLVLNRKYKTDAV